MLERGEGARAQEWWGSRSREATGELEKMLPRIRSAGSGQLFLRGKCCLG